MLHCSRFIIHSPFGHLSFSSDHITPLLKALRWLLADPRQAIPPWPLGPNIFRLLLSDLHPSPSGTLCPYCPDLHLTPNGQASSTFRSLFSLLPQPGMLQLFLGDHSSKWHLPKQSFPDHPVHPKCTTHLPGTLCPAVQFISFMALKI